MLLVGALANVSPAEARPSQPRDSTATGAPPLAVFTIAAPAEPLQLVMFLKVSHEPVTIGAAALRSVHGVASLSSDSIDHGAPATAGHSVRQRTLANSAAIHRATLVSVLHSTSNSYRPVLPNPAGPAAVVIHSMRSSNVPAPVIGHSAFPLYL